MMENLEALIARLSEAVGAEQVLVGEDIGADFTHDEYPGAAFAPDAVVEAKNTEQVSAVLAACTKAGVPVTIRGAGTGQVGGSVPIRGGVVLSLRGMNQILDLDEDAKTITIQPGVLLQDVKAAADAKGLYYPPDPGEQTATVGGNAATNAGGPCAVKYGTTKDYVLDAVLVKADGTVARLSEDAANLAVLGSEGTLAAITELTLRLLDKPGADAILLFPFLDVETAVNAARTILAADYDPAVVELLDTDLVEFSGNVTGNPVFPVEMDGDRIGATLMVTLEADDDDAVMEKMEQIAELAEEIECLDILVMDTPTMKRDAWAAHAAFHTSMESGCRCAWEANVDIPIDAAAEMVAFAKEAGEKNGLKVYLHAHLGSGGMHLHAGSDLSREEAAAGAQAFLSEVYGKTAELGGSIVGEYGVGYAKTAFLSDVEKAAFAEKKARFDPEGILNPGKIIS